MRSDVYSCGVMLFHMLTGRRPFEAASNYDVLRMHLDTQPKSLLEVGAGAWIPDAVEGVVMRALSKRPAERFQSAGELRRALEHAVVIDYAHTGGRNGGVPETLSAGSRFLCLAIIAAAARRYWRGISCGPARPPGETPSPPPRRHPRRRSRATNRPRPRSRRESRPSGASATSGSRPARPRKRAAARTASGAAPGPGSILAGFSMRHRWSLVAALMIIGAARPARADGAFPDSLQILLPADRPNVIGLATNFGVILSEDAGRTWQWVCELEELQYATLYQVGPPPLNRFFAASIHGVVSSDDLACTWRVAGGLFAGAVGRDVFPDPSDPDHVLAIALPIEGQAVFESTNGGLTFDRVVHQAGPQETAVGVEIAASDPRTIYVAGYLGPGVRP